MQAGDCVGFRAWGGGVVGVIICFGTNLGVYGVGVLDPVSSGDRRHTGNKLSSEALQSSYLSFMNPGDALINYTALFIKVKKP